MRFFGHPESYVEKEIPGATDTRTALRTILIKDGMAYLQAGGGIVFDSDLYEEWVETLNKLGMFVSSHSDNSDD